MKLQIAINKLKNNRDGKVLFANFWYLSLLQVASYIFPLITVPYLSRVIGVEGFGKIAFASSVIVWFQTITDWGFNMTATRDIAKNRHNPEIVSSIFSNVFWARILLMLISLVLLLSLISFVPKFKESAGVILVTFMLIPGHILFPEWFFQALERMKYITIFNIVIKVLFTVAVFLFVKSPDDYILQPLFTSLGYIVCGGVSLYIIIKKWRVNLRWTSIKQIIETIKSSTDVFLNTIFPNFYNSFSSILLGFVGGPSANGMLSAAEKIEGAVQQLLTVLTRVFFPFLSRRIDKHKLFARINIGISVISFLLLFILAPIIIDFFYTDEFLDAIPVLRILSISLVFLAMSKTYGANYLIIQGHDKQLRQITIICSIIGFILSITFVTIFSYMGVAVTITLTRGLIGVSAMIKAKQFMKLKNN